MKINDLIGISQQDEDKNFLEACFIQDLEQIKLSLKFGANINAKSPSGINGLYISVLNNNLEIARFLLEQGINIEPSARDYPPLLAAVSFQNYRMIDLLLRYKSSLKNIFKIDYIKYAIDLNDELMLNIFLHHQVPLDLTDNMLKNQIYYAAFLKRTRCLNAFMCYKDQYQISDQLLKKVQEIKDGKKIL